MTWPDSNLGNYAERIDDIVQNKCNFVAKV